MACILITSIIHYCYIQIFNDHEYIYALHPIFILPQCLPMKGSLSYFVSLFSSHLDTTNRSTPRSQKQLATNTNTKSNPGLDHRAQPAPVPTPNSPIVCSLSHALTQSGGGNSSSTSLNQANSDVGNSPGESRPPPPSLHRLTHMP